MSQRISRWYWIVALTMLGIAIVALIFSVSATVILGLEWVNVGKNNWTLFELGTTIMFYLVLISTSQIILGLAIFPYPIKSKKTNNNSIAQERRRKMNKHVHSSRAKSIPITWKIGMVAFPILGGILLWWLFYSTGLRGTIVIVALFELVALPMTYITYKRIKNNVR